MQLHTYREELLVAVLVIRVGNQRGVERDSGRVNLLSVYGDRQPERGDARRGRAECTVK